MVSPIIICNGMIRSGSTWSFNVCRLLGHLLAKRRRGILGGAYLTADILDQFLLNHAQTLDGIAVIKAHETGPVAANWIRAGRAKAICTLRDPRDCVASDVLFWSGGFDISVRRVITSLRLISSGADFGRTLFIRYEEMMADPRSQIRSIAAYLRISITDAEIESIDAQTSIPASRKVCDGLSSRDDAHVETISNAHRRDAITLLHDNHIGSAEIGRWKTDLTPDQGRLVTQLFQKSLLALGYETRA